MNEEKKYPIILLLRYSNYHGIDTIDEHKKVIDKNGYCWFGKIGKIPSQKYISTFQKEEDNIAYLYTYGILHECRISEISFERPIDGTPSYYEHELYIKEDLTPQIFFKLDYIKEADVDILDNYLVVSSGKDIKYDLKKSISSFYLIRDKKAGFTPRKKRQTNTTTFSPPKKAKIPKDCVFNDNNTCLNPKCINYNYDCIGAQRCVKQKSK